MRSERAGGEPLLICDRPRQVGRCTRTSVLLEQVGQAEKSSATRIGSVPGVVRAAASSFAKDGRSCASHCHRFSSAGAGSAQARQGNVLRSQRRVGEVLTDDLLCQLGGSRPSERREICAACYSEILTLGGLEGTVWPRWLPRDARRPRWPSLRHGAHGGVRQREPRESPRA